MISVITPSNRNIEGLRVVEKALRRQTFKSFEWIIGSPEKPKGLSLPFVWVQDPPKEEGDYWVLNKLYNKMVSKSSGDLLVSVQDFTSFDPQALHKFNYHFTKDNKSAVSGVGGKYSGKDFVSSVWVDPRERQDMGTFYEVSFPDWEGNFGSIPRKALYEVGGFDEELDKFAGMDWYSVNNRAYALGAATHYIDQTNKSYSLEHGRYDNWDERNAIDGPYQKRQDYYKEVGWKLDYLTESL
jgi:hypothetical protein